MLELFDKTEGNSLSVKLPANSPQISKLTFEPNLSNTLIVKQ